MLSDPGSVPEAHAIRHIIGNIGRPGLALLVLPPEPQSLQPSPDSWNVINRETYDGTSKDGFAGTSLHLQFSDWTIAVDVGASGQGHRDVEASLVESFIQIIVSHGKWIADLEILSALRQGHSQFDHRYYFKAQCNHDRPSKQAEEQLKEYLKKFPLTSIDSWEQFVDRPNGPTIVRAQDNWLARMTTTVLCCK